MFEPSEDVESVRRRGKVVFVPGIHESRDEEKAYADDSEDVSGEDEFNAHSWSAFSKNSRK
jgi:hypothetical protein